MATQANLEQVQLAYISFFGRPADPTGLEFWADALDSGAETLESLFTVFEQSDEGVNLNLSNEEFVAAVYQQALGRPYNNAADADGTFWLDALNSGAETKASLTYAIAEGAFNGPDNTDRQAVHNKVEASLQITAAADSDAQFDQVKSELVDAVASVTSSDASVQAGVDAAVAALDNTGTGDGASFTLTEGRDMLEGTTGDDEFFGDVGQNSNGASANALSTGDRIDGGAGIDKLYATVVNDNQVDGADNDNLSINARTENLEEVYLSVLDEDVNVDAGRMDGVDQFWSDDSDEDLHINDVRLGTGQSVTKDITFGLKDVDQDSGLTAAFDTNSLTNEGTTTSNSQLLVRIADVSTETPDTPLANVNVNLSFDLGGETVTLNNVQSTDGTYAGLVSAIDTALDAAGYPAVTVALSTAYTQVTFADNTVNLPFTAQEILLTDPSGATFSNVNFTQSAIQPVAGGFLVAGNADPVAPGTSTTLIETNLILDNAGRGSTAGDVVIGGMSNSGETIDKLNLMVDRNSKIDDLGTASDMETATTLDEGFSEIEITSMGSNGLLSIGNIDDTTTVNASAFAGESLTIGAASDLQTLNAAINGDVTVTANTAAAANVYTTGSGDDTLTVEVTGDDVDATGESFTANTGSGDDTVNITMTAGASQQTMEELSNLDINTGSGEDTVNLDAYGRFDVSTGNDSDYVRINSEDNNGNGAIGSWTFGDNTGPQDFAERVLYEAELTVSFAGFESTVAVETDSAGNFKATQADINDAIKQAISNNPELSKLLTVTDNDGTQQITVASTVAGENTLAIALYQPELVANNATDGQVVLASGDLSSIRQGLIDTTNLDSEDLETVAEVVAETDTGSASGFSGSLNQNGVSDNTVYTYTQNDTVIDNDVGDNAATATTNDIFDVAGAGLYQQYSNGGSTDSTTGISFSTVNLGNGSNDLVVLHSREDSANVIEITGAFGKTSVVNFHDAATSDVDTAAEVGNHALDFSAHLDNDRDPSANPSGNSQSVEDITTTVNIVNGANAFADSAAGSNLAVANSVNLIRFDGDADDTFANLDATTLVNALNATTAANEYGNLNDALLSAADYDDTNGDLVGSTQKHIVMVENDLNEGEYKVFALTSTIQADDSVTNGDFDSSAQLLGTLDFGASVNLQVVGTTAWQTLIDNLTSTYNDYSFNNALTYAIADIPAALDYHVEDTIANINTEATGGSAKLVAAQSITASDIGDGEVITLTGLTSSVTPTAVDFADDAATVTQTQYTAYGNLLTASDDITLSGGVNTGAEIATAGADTDVDTVEVDDDEGAITVSVAQLNTITQSVVADADGTGTESTIEVALANTNSVTAGGDVVDLAIVYNASTLTDGQSATIAGTQLESGDSVNVGVIAGLTLGSAVTDNVTADPVVMDLAVSNDGTDTTIEWELTDPGTLNSDNTTASITLTGVQLTNTDFSFDQASGLLTLS